MPRMVTISAAAAAALLSIATIASMWRPLYWVGAPGQADIGLAQCRFVYDALSPFLGDISASRQNLRDLEGIHSADSPWLPSLERLPGGPNSRSYIYLAIPLWPFALGLAATALVTHRRVPRNTCPHCRYDLTGLGPSLPCPECGAPRHS